MANVYYLDVDDEITSAAARIRASQDPRVGLVVPAGPRIAPPRINFRLLAREAVERNRALSIVSTDPAARALAASAGLPVYATVGDFEADQGDQIGGLAGGQLGAAGSVVAGGAGVADSASRVRRPVSDEPVRAGQAGVSAGVGARSSGTAAPVVRPANRSQRSPVRFIAPLVTLVVIALVFGLIGV